jgi:hypothetical protein
MAVSSITFARRVFQIAGLYGVIVLVPQIFLADRIGRDSPPPITHLEYFYGFLGIALAWQLAFLVIARDPIRYRTMMIPAILEKASFALVTTILFVQGGLAAQMLGAGMLDLTLGVLFTIAYVRTRPASPGPVR